MPTSRRRQELRTASYYIAGAIDDMIKNIHVYDDEDTNELAKIALKSAIEIFEGGVARVREALK